MIKGLVSLITPAYNTGNLISRLLDSVLKQDYPTIEMYVIDDGSTDNTKSVVESFIPDFDKKGYCLSYLYQDNQGQSVAINKGLKLVKGEFLAWPDSDDFYANTHSISTLVQALRNSSGDTCLVQCQYLKVNEDTLLPVETIRSIFSHDVFSDCLYGNFNFCPGGYIAKISDIDKFIKDREIYTEKNAGQNWQILLPLLYNKKAISLDDVLYIVVERKTSHSRGQFKTYEQQIQKYVTYKNTLLETLKRIQEMPDAEKTLYSKRIETKYLSLFFELSLRNIKIKESKEYFSLMRKEGNFTRILITIITKVTKFIFRKITNVLFIRKLNA